MSKQLERLKYFHIMTREGYYPSSRTIKEHFNVTIRTAYRDIRILKEMFKAPLKYNHIQHGYYYTKQDWRLFE
jgi:predicted DNA-binding transcriptional regulator YafY